MVNSKIIKTKSSELDIPFSHVLSGYILETVVSMIAEAPYANEMWLGNGEILGITVYKKKTSKTLVYWYNGKKSLEEFATIFRQDLETYYKKISIEIKKIEQHSNKREEIFSVEASLDEMYIPLNIHIMKVENVHGFPKEETLHLFMENNKTITLQHYPLEQSVAYHLAEILKNLELINDMEHYIILYDILRKQPLEGRKVKDELDRLCEEMHIQKTEKPFALWSTYGTYTYMKKKWKVLLRRERREEPAWQDAFGLLKTFSEPVWNAVCRGEVFFGDWMPGLERFLD